MPVIRRFKPTVGGGAAAPAAAAPQTHASTEHPLSPVGPGPPQTEPVPHTAKDIIAESSVVVTTVTTELTVSQHHAPPAIHDTHSPPINRKRPTSISLSVTSSISLSRLTDDAPAALTDTPTTTAATTTTTTITANEQVNSSKSASSSEPLHIRRAHVSQSALQENLRLSISESLIGSPLPSPSLHNTSAAGKGTKRSGMLGRSIELPSKDDIVVEKLKMRDFLVFNPDGSPMRWRKQLITDANEAVEAVISLNMENAASVDHNKSSPNIKERLRAASGMMSPPPPPPQPPSASMGTPRVRLGESGEAIVNEESLVIDTTTRPDPSTVSRVGAVHEELESTTTYTTYANYRRKGRCRGRRWSKEETARFFVALRCCGLDFSMISKFFPDRDERELRNKFRAEDKRDPDVVTKFLTGNGDNDLATYDPLALLATSTLNLDADKSKSEESEVIKKKRPPKSNSKRGKGVPRGRGPKVCLSIGEDSISSDSEDAGSEDTEIVVKKSHGKRLKIVSESSMGSANGDSSHDALQPVS